jgi:hypothetical protein
MLENVTLIMLLMVLGAGVTAALIVGFIYWMEFQND